MEVNLPGNTSPMIFRFTLTAERTLTETPCCLAAPPRYNVPQGLNQRTPKEQLDSPLEVVESPTPLRALSGAEMAERPVWILKSKRTGTGRKHMAFFVANAHCVNYDPNDRTKACIGTKIHVTGAPMAGFCHEFQRNYNCSGDSNVESATMLACVDCKYITDPKHRTFSTDQAALGKGILDDLALRVPTPSLTKDYLNPAKAQDIQDCQDWIRDYIKYLMAKGVLDSKNEQIEEDLIDPQVGIRLRPIVPSKGST